MRWIVSLVPLLAALLPMPLVAASFCVSNSAELQAAIAAAASNADSNDTIRLRPGVYPSPPNGFGGVTFAPGDNLSISGGWRPLIGPCDLPGYDATASVIDGEEQRAGLVLSRSSAGSGETNLSWLTIRGGRRMQSVALFGYGGGLAIFQSGPVSIRNMAFENNRALRSGGAVFIEGSQATLRNNLFIDNQAGNGAALYLTSGGETVLSNNTAAHNLCDDDDGHAVDLWGPAVSAWNNIFHSNLGGNVSCDLHASNALLTQNIVGQFCGSMHGLSQGNTSADPQFVGATDLRLRRTSPAIDSGVNNSVGTHDLDGRPRQIGPATDLGAYEADFLLVDGFE